VADPSTTGTGAAAASRTGVAVGIDIGGTKLAAGLVAADGTVLERARKETPALDASAIIDAVADIVEELVGDQRVPVGVGAAGLIGPGGSVRYAPNIDWVDYPLRSKLADRLAGPVTVDNDANTAAWAEYRCGAGRDAPTSMAMLTLGTGVGGGLVVHGRLVRGASGMAGELGHLIVSEGGHPCPCGNLGCLEAYASGTAIGLLAREAVAAGTVAEASPLRSAGVLDGKAVTEAAQAGDADAIDVLAEAGRWLGVGIASIVNALEPEVVVIGGGAMQAGELILEPARSAAQDRLVGRAARTLPPVVPAELGDAAGLVGAALLAADEQG
jgi:glucokinase